MINNTLDIISLKTFSSFSEYFIALSVIYMLIVATLITYNAYGLIFQKSLSELAGILLLMACYLMLNDDLIALDYLSFHNSVINDYLSLFSKLVICFFSSMYLLFISNSLKEQRLTSFEYIIILLSAILGLTVMCSSNDLLLVYLSLELTSLASYVLAAFRKTSSYSIESGVKYFITGAVSSALFLLGSSFIYGSSGSINFGDFYDLFGSRSSFFNDPASLPESFFNAGFLELGVALILFSLFIKLALAPFHLWSLDVYEGSPTSSTIFFAVIAKLSIFIVLIRLCYTSFSMVHCWQFYSVLVGVLSVFVGSFGGLKQRKFKTLIAYSSTSHMGYALLAISSATYFGVQMLLFYMVVYIISSLCIWSVFLFLRLKQKKNDMLKYNKELGDFVLLKKSNYLLAFSLSLSMFSLAGIPPLIGFIGKIGVFLSLIKSNFYFIAFIAILFSVVSTFYYIRVVKVLYFENILVGNLYHPIKQEKTLLFSLLIFSLIFLFAKPTFLYLVCYKSVLLLI